MDRTFTDVVYETLQQMGPEILTDAPRFLSCTQDLATGFETEKKFMKRGFDRKYLDICSGALTCSPMELNSVQNKASAYLKREYLMADEWADRISEAMVQGISWYVHPEKRNADRLQRSLEASEGATILDEAQKQIFSGRPPLSPQPQPERPQNFSGSGAAGPAFSGAAGPAFQPAVNGGAAGRASSGKRRLSKWIILCIAVILGFGIGAIAYVITRAPEAQDTVREETTAAAETAAAEETEAAETAPADGTASAEVPVAVSQVKKLHYDIDFSQLKRDDGIEHELLTPSVNGVNIFMQVRNDSPTTAIRCVEFTFQQNGKKISNLKGGDFRVYGYIEPGKTGYMFGKMYMADETRDAKKRQGKVTLTKVAAYGPSPEAPDYRPVPGGSIVDHDQKTDVYKVNVVNNSGCPVRADSSYLLVVWEKPEFEDTYWGAGKLGQDLQPGQAYADTQAIYNPNWGFEEEGSEEGMAYDLYHNFKVIILDTQYLE